MSKGKRYTAVFNSEQSVAWRIEIWQEGYQGEAEEAALGEEPLVIEWPETDKLEPVQSSNATLQLYSDTDRQFLELYTVEAGSVRMDVYREDVLYWSGTLDAELYEEPYSFKTDYTVTLTFSDFAILDRLSFDGTGFVSLKELFTKILEKTGINYSGFQEYISTGMVSGAGATLTADISVLSDNYYDEDGEAMTWREVLDETLRPFALRMVQKAGKVFIYDLNAVSTLLEPETVVWDSDDAVLGTDSVYNNVTIKYSPYFRQKLLDGSVDKGTVKEDTLSPTYSVNVDLSGENVPGFKITFTDSGVGIVKGEQAKYFKVDKIFSGSDDAGVAWTFKNLETGNKWVDKLNPPTSVIGSYMVCAAKDRPYIAYTSKSRGEKYYLKVLLNIMVDVRYNPYESAGDNNEKTSWENFQDRFNFNYIPIKLVLRDAEGNALLHYDNKEVKVAPGGYSDTGKWVAGEAEWGDAFLAYYDIDNRKSANGLGGWTANKQCIGYYRGALPTLFQKRGDGEFIDLPDKSGFLDFQVGSGMLCYDYDSGSDWQLSSGYYYIVKYILFKDFSIELVDGNYQTVEQSDIEVKAWLNRSAKEDLEIKTILGTMDDASSTALGQTFRTSTKEVWNTFYRAGEYGKLETLLAGTVYTHYASRHVTLSGEAALVPSFGVYSDNNMEGVFILLSEKQNLEKDTGTILMAQTEADNYTGIELENE